METRPATTWIKAKDYKPYIKERAIWVLFPLGIKIYDREDLSYLEKVEEFKKLQPYILKKLLLHLKRKANMLRFVYINKLDTEPSPYNPELTVQQHRARIREEKAMIKRALSERKTKWKNPRKPKAKNENVLTLLLQPDN